MRSSDSLIGRTPLTNFQTEYISIQCDKRNSYRAGVRVRQRAAATSDPGATSADGAAALSGAATHPSVSPTTAKQSPARNGHARAADNVDGEPVAKRPRRSTLSNGDAPNGRHMNGEAGTADDEEEIEDIEDVGQEEDEGHEDVDGEEEDDEGEEEEGEESGGENDVLREDPIEVGDVPDESSGEEDEEGEDDSD